MFTLVAPSSAYNIFIYKFHNHFDGLLGLDILDNCQIDLKYNILNTEHAKIPMLLYQCRQINSQETIPAKSSRLIKMPIYNHDGSIYVNEQIVCHCIIHECITTVTDEVGIVEIENSTNHDIIISLG